MLRRNVLIFHTGALGDLVLSWPLALAAGRLFPQSRIIYVTHGEKGALCERVLRVEWADIEVGWHRLFSDGELPVQQGKALAGAHTIFSFLTEADDAWSTNVASVNPGARLIHLRTRPPEGYVRHASDYLRDQLARETAIYRAVDQMLRSVNVRGVGSRAGRADGPVVIHPGSGSRDKCWPIENYIQVIERLKSAHRPVRVCIGQVERERWSETQIKSLSKVAPLAQPDNLIELLGVLSDASAYIGNDSGPTHMAGSLGLATTAIFTVTDPDVWKPLGPNVRALLNPSVEEISGQ